MPTRTDTVTDRRTVSAAPAGPAATESYASAYSRLQAIAEKLRTGGANAAIDEIVDDLRAARAAHAVCRARLDAVRREVDRELEELGEAGN